LISAIPLIKISPAKEQGEVYNELLRIPEVVDAHVVFGEYGLIAKIKTKNFNAFVEIVNENIEIITGVIDTKVNFYPVGRK
jgi:DNA-binding Lrp family transcriptional regulator